MSAFLALKEYYADLMPIFFSSKRIVVKLLFCTMYICDFVIHITLFFNNRFGCFQVYYRELQKQFEAAEL